MDWFCSVLRGMLDHRFSAFFKALMALVQWTRSLARGPRFQDSSSFIAIVCLRLGKLTHVPASLFVPAMALSAGLARIGGELRLHAGRHYVAG